MLKIRLQRVGRKHEPSFRLVLTDSKNSTKSGRVDEVLGSYDPRKTSETFKTDRIKHWISQGISFTPVVNNLLIKKSIINGKKVHVSTVPPPAPVVEAPVEATVEQAPVETAPEPVVEAVPEPVVEAAPEPVVVVEEVPVEAIPEAPVESLQESVEETPAPAASEAPTDETVS